MSETTYYVKSRVPAHLVWSAAEHSRNDYVRITLLFTGADGKEWRVRNSDIRGVLRQPHRRVWLEIHLYNDTTILYSPRTGEGVITVPDGASSAPAQSAIEQLESIEAPKSRRRGW